MSIHIGAAAMLHDASLLVLYCYRQALLSSIIVGFFDSLIVVLVPSHDRLQFVDYVRVSLFIFEGNGGLLCFCPFQRSLGILGLGNLGGSLGVILGQVLRLLVLGGRQLLFIEGFVFHDETLFGSFNVPTSLIRGSLGVLSLRELGLCLLLESYTFLLLRQRLVFPFEFGVSEVALLALAETSGLLVLSPTIHLV